MSYGHLEKVYENALGHRLRKQGPVIAQRYALNVFDEDGTVLGDYLADLFVENVLIVEDVVSSGGQIIESVTMLRDDRINISQALCVIDRETGGCEKLKEAGIELISLFKQSELDAITSRT